MVTHFHPDDVFPSSSRYPLLGSKGFKRILDQYRPELWICGHLHSQTGIKLYWEKTNTLLIRVCCILSGINGYTNTRFGNVYWSLELENDGNINAIYSSLI